MKRQRGRTQTSSAGSSTLTENSEHALILMCFLENERKNRKHIVKSDSSARTSSDSTHFFLLAFCHRSLDEPKKTAPNKHRDCSCDLEIFSSERDRLGMAGGEAANQTSRKRERLKTRLALGITLKRRKNYIMMPLHVGTLIIYTMPE